MPKFHQYTPNPIWSKWFAARSSLVMVRSEREELEAWLAERSGYRRDNRSVVDMERDRIDDRIYTFASGAFLTMCPELAFEFKMRWC